MAKTIKFNLICDGNPVRTIEDLQNNFSIEDILGYYESKLLHKWLDVRGYHAELEKVNNIQTENTLEIVKDLIKIFGVVQDDNKIEESVYILEYLKEKEVLYYTYFNAEQKVQQIVEDYHTGYRQLVDEIINNPKDVAKIKAAISEIANQYKWIFKLNHRNLFYILKDYSPLAIMCFLMNDYTREYFLPKEIVDENGNITYDTARNNDKATMYELLCKMIISQEFRDDLESHLVSFAGKTDDYWKDLEPKGKRYMIISIGQGDYVRAAGVLGGDLSKKDIENKFVILDGIDYKSNSALRELRYMEV